MATAASSFHEALESLLQALFPSACACCGQILAQGERQICLTCLADLSYTHFSSLDDNPTERLLAAIPSLCHASSLLHFHQENTVQKLVHAMKFHNGTELCIEMGRQMGLDLLHSARFDDVDILIPVPLHWTRRLQRGYNQSELLSLGISQTFGRPLGHRLLLRHRRTPQQSLQNSSARSSNVQDAFRTPHPERLQDKHILLIDDVVTTGATLASCCQPLSQIPGISISIATLAIAGC